jgi:hypothetical protein
MFPNTGRSVLKIENLFFLLLFKTPSLFVGNSWNCLRLLLLALIYFIIFAQIGVLTAGFAATPSITQATQVSGTYLPPRSFTVQDSIEMPRVVPLITGYFSDSDLLPLFSPDQAHFLLLTRKGNLDANVIIENLLLFSTKEVLDYLKVKGGTPPKPKIVFEATIAGDSGEISGVRWINNKQIALISGDHQQRKQVYFVATDSLRSIQATQALTDVQSFATNGHELLYYAISPDPTFTASSEVITPEPLLDVLFPHEDRGSMPLEIYRISALGQQDINLKQPKVRLAEFFNNIWISPSGAYAVVLFPATNAPKEWSEYEIPDYDMFGYTPDKVSSDFASGQLIFRVRYWILDLTKNTARPLLDAPNGWLSQNLTPIEVFWTKDERSVIVSNTYLPLNSDQGTIEERKLKPAIAEIDISSGAISLITFEPTRTEKQQAEGLARESIVSIAWNPPTEVLTVKQRLRDKTIINQQYKRFEGRWNTLQHTVDAAMLLKIEKQEGLNTRPVVRVTHSRCRCSKVLYDPAPYADRFAFGHAAPFTWIDKNSIEWHGGLILPPNYKKGQRYPLVVQTHGFQDDEFLTDGPYGTTTAMAALPLASAGLIVLQIEDNRKALTMDEREASLFVEGYRAGIEKLVTEGIVDEDNIGLIAFSRTGMYAIKLLAEHPNLLKALNISDGQWWGYLIDLLSVNRPSDLSEQGWRVSGGTASPNDIAGWISKNPLYKIGRAPTAIRLEANGPASVLGFWEHFALLRKAEAAIDFLYFPQGSHVLKRPQERLASQGGNVDWFRFWLQDYEDPHPSKEKQYIRWRDMRAKQRKKAGH